MNENTTGRARTKQVLLKILNRTSNSQVLVGLLPNYSVGAGFYLLINSIVNELESEDVVQRYVQV